MTSSHDDSTSTEETTMNQSSSAAPTPDSAHKRSRFLVLPNFQLRFMLYILGFAAFGIVVMYVSNHLYFARLVAEGEVLGLAPDHVYFEFVDQQRGVLNATFGVVSAIVFGGLILAGLALSHKIAGPVYRVQRYLEEVRSSGVPENELKFRDRDFFPEIAELVNEIAQAYRTQRD